MENRSHQESRPSIFGGKHPFSGPSISQETLRIENPSVSWVCVFLPWEGVRWRWLFQGRWCQRLEWRSRLTLLMRGECERVFGGLWYGEVFVAWFLLCALFRWEAIRCYHWSLQVHTFRAMADHSARAQKPTFSAANMWMSLCSHLLMGKNPHERSFFFRKIAAFQT